MQSTYHQPGVVMSFLDSEKPYLFGSFWYFTNKSILKGKSIFIFWHDKRIYDNPNKWLKN